MANTFPTSKADALTMLYLSTHNFKSLSPKALLDKYDEIHQELAEYDCEKDQANYDFL